MLAGLRSVGTTSKGDTSTRAFRRHRRQPCLTLASLHKQSILCFLSYDAQRLYALWIPNLNPVGFCVVCAFCGNYKQRRYKYKSFSPINCNLQFYHSKFRMNHVFYVYSRIYFPAHRATALSEGKASRRLGKYIRGGNCYCKRPAATAIV